MQYTPLVIPPSADLDIAVEYDEELLEEGEVAKVGRVELVRRRSRGNRATGT